MRSGRDGAELAGGAPVTRDLGTVLPDGLLGEVVPLDQERLEVAAPDAAQRLLGAVLVHRLPTGGRVAARIVETEAYREDDPASHSYRGRTPRTEPMFGRPGLAYLYRSYGIHWCANVSVEHAGTGAAVLLRAARVVAGIDEVRARRAGTTDAGLLRGPGNLAAGLGLHGDQHGGVDLLDATGALLLGSDGWWPPPSTVITGPRVGVSQAPDRRWRYHLAGVAEVSSYRRSPRARRRG